MTGVKRRICPDSDIHALYKELDEVSCPICMDHPHNAVLLICSSHEKGCRSYICDTSYRHSNCLDRFKKLRDNPIDDTTLSSSLPVESFNSDNNPETSLTLRMHRSHPIRNQNFIGTNNAISTGFDARTIEHSLQNPSRRMEMREDSMEGHSEPFHDRNEIEVVDLENSSESVLSLKCPLCRGAILGWQVVEEVRKYLNLKNRSCSCESCSFSGNYQDLRQHARRIHPTSRPSDVDPSRERAWRSLVRQREYGDVVSAIRSAIPDAVVVGDYVIENGDRLPLDSASVTGEGNAPLWRNAFFLFHMFGSIDGEPRARSRAWARHRRPPGAAPERRFLWGENLLGLQDEDDDNENDDDLHILSDVGEDAPPVPRRRRHLTRSRSDDQS